jgi:GT2 family glycosyltransferase
VHTGELGRSHVAVPRRPTGHAGACRGAGSERGGHLDGVPTGPSGHPGQDLLDHDRDPHRASLLTDWADTVPGVEHATEQTTVVPPLVTVVVVTWQGAHLLPPCLDSLAAQTLDHRLVVVDNASTDGTGDLLAARPGIRVVRAPRNLGFAGGVQLGIDAVDTEFVALLNNDAVADPQWLTGLLRAAHEHPRAAAVTSLMLLAGHDREVLNNAGVVLLRDWYGADRGLGAAPGAFSTPDEVFGFSGGAAMLRTSAIREVGGFASEFFLYYEDTELSWRLRDAGWTVRYEPAAVVVHEHSASTDQRSRSFAYHNERNRLWTLLRRAPLRVAVTAVVRFTVTTASLTIRSATGRSGPSRPWNMRPALRLQVLRDVLRYLPTAARERRRRPPGPAPHRMSV